MFPHLLLHRRLLSLPRVRRRRGERGREGRRIWVILQKTKERRKRERRKRTECGKKSSRHTRTPNPTVDGHCFSLTPFRPPSVAVLFVCVCGQDPVQLPWTSLSPEWTTCMESPSTPTVFCSRRPRTSVSSYSLSLTLSLPSSLLFSRFVFPSFPKRGGPLSSVQSRCV